MEGIALISIIIGILIIVFRAPLIVAPDISMKLFSEKLAVNNNKIRILGIFVLLFGVMVITVGHRSEIVVETLIIILGSIIAIFSIFLLLIFPGVYRRLIDFFSDVNNAVLRVFGIIGVAVGIFFIYHGFSILLS